MAKIDLTQSDVNKYLATIDEFWDTFHKGLKAPFSLWNENKEDSKESWIKRVGRTNELVSLINLIFKNTPLLKGEFPVCNNRFMILTNYRLFINMDTGLVIIPLKDLTFYGEVLFHGERVDESSTIEYKKNEETLIIRLSTYMGGGYVEKTKRAGEYNDLDDLSQSLLSMTHYDYEKKNLNPSNFELLKTNSPISSLFSIINVKEMNMKKWLYLGIGLFFLVYLFSGGADVPDGQKMFIDKWQRLKDVNDESGGKKHLKDNQSPVVKWYGEVEKNLSFNKNEILVEYEDIEFTLEPIWILEDDEINKIKSLKKGDEVYFTGKLNGEKSITLWGMLDEPEMNVICSKLTNIDETTIYYDIPPEKQVVIRTKSDYEKAVIGKWSGNESTNLYDYGWSYSGIMLELKLDFTFTEYDLKGEWMSTKDWKQTHHWEKDSYGTWEIHHGNYSDTGDEYWAVEIHYAGVTRDWRFVIELTEYENAIKNIFYDLRLYSGGYGENLFLGQGDILKKGKK